jgi:Aromatic-ring-opening dioxygenase LigAB, LigA subunit
MSVIAIHKLCREFLRDHVCRPAMKTNPAAAIEKYDLTPEEKKALLAGDGVTLHHMGVNDFMMGYLARFGSCRLSVPIYNEKISSIPH